MDRPAILTLVDNDGNDHEVVLTGITDGNAELSLGGVRVTHSVTDISDVWLGEFMLLWRPPTGAAVSLGPGSRGGDVAWLRNSLAAIDGRYASTDVQSEVFDAELEQLVRSFQRDHRLEVDGLAGQQTQIIINSLLAVEGTPRLSTPRLAQD
jgi:general secretion pathway protein A